MFLSRIAAAGLCAAGFVSEPAFAQNSGGVETVVVTAEKRSENIQNVPITISAFTSKQITDLGLKASTDIGQLVPNVDVALPAGAGNQPIISIRGIGLNDYDTNNAGPNGIYVDEVYLSSPASQTFQAFDLERIEVLKGPQGTLYGRNASGGDINFITNKPTDDFTADAHVEYGSYNTFQFEGAMGGQIAPDLDARIAVLKNNSGGYMYNAFTGTDANGANNLAGRFLLQYQPTQNLKILWNFHGGDVANRPTEYRHLGTWVPGTFSLATFSGVPCSIAAINSGACVDMFNYGTTKSFYSGSYNRMLHLDVANYGTSLRTDFSPGSVTFTNITAYEHNYKLHPEDSDASPNQLLEINFGVRNDELTEEFRASQSAETYDWVAGVYYLWEDLHQDQPLNLFYDGDLFYGPGSFNGVALQAADSSDQVSNSVALYTQGDYKLTDQLQLTLGARGTLDTKRFAYNGSFEVQTDGRGVYSSPIPVASLTRTLTNPDFDWKAVLDYHFTDDVHAYASVATGYKAGGFNGSFLSQSPAQAAAQLAPISPEHVLTYELGLKSTAFDDRLVADGSLFYNQYRDMQVFALVVGPGGLPNNVLTNAQQAHTDGADLSFIGKPIDNLTLNVQAGLLQTRLDKYVPGVTGGANYTGNQLQLSPHFSMSDLADYAVPLRDGVLDFQFGASYKGHQFFDIGNNPFFVPPAGNPNAHQQDPYTVQSSYWLENVRVSYAIDDGRWEIAGWVRNLSNKEYYLDEFNLMAPFGFIQGIVGTPRTIGFEVNFKY
jgi:iron complex outermembrane receptor protein